MNICFNVTKKNIIISVFAIFLLVVLIITSFFILIYMNNSNPTQYFDEKNFYANIAPTTELIEKEKLSKEIIEKYKDKKVIALTFDDGPSKYTEKLLDILDLQNVKATFFILGYKAKDNPDIIKKAYDKGHEIGIHGYSHSLFTRLSEEEIRTEIENCKDILKSITNKNVSLIRVPYGIANDTVDSIIKEYGLTNIFWNIDSNDWKLKNKSKISKRVLKGAKDKRIILMHDTYSYSVNAIDTIIKELKENDYFFVTVSELLTLKHADS